MSRYDTMFEGLSARGEGAFGAESRRSERALLWRGPGDADQACTGKPRRPGSTWIGASLNSRTRFTRSNTREAVIPLSSARWAATVSVVKYGLPVPAAKITTRPFSR